MIPVSDAWQQASRAQFRYQMYLKARLDLSPPGLRQNMQVSSDDTFEQSTIGSLTDQNEKPSTKYTTLERNRWILNGKSKTLPKNVLTTGWWSQNICTESNPVIIRFDFDMLYTVPGISIVMDTEDGTWASKVIVKGFDEDNVEKYSITIDDITKDTDYLEADMSLIKAAELHIVSWSVPGWRARILEMGFGVLLMFDSINEGRINGASTQRSVSVIGEELPTYNATISFRNLDKYFDPLMRKGVSKHLAAKQYFTLQWGFVTSPDNLEWMNPLPMFTRDFTIPEDSKDVSINLTNRLTLMSDDFQKASYTQLSTSKTLYAVANEVLQNSDIVNELEGQTPWILSESMKNFSTNAPIPTLPSNQILQLLAQASCTVLDTDGTTGFIVFRDLQSSVSQYCAIDENQELGDPGITIRDRLQSIAFNVYSYKVVDEATEIGKSEYTLSEQTEVRVKYNVNNAINVSATVTNGTIVSATYYLGYAFLTLQPSTVGAIVSVTLTGKSIESTSTLIETYRNTKIPTGVNVVIANPFITTTEYLQQQSDFIRNYYEKRTQYKLPYLGYLQLEPIDRINLHTVYGGGPVDVISNSLDFNGGVTGTVETL